MANNMPRVVIRKNEFKRLKKLSSGEADKILGAIALEGEAIVKRLVEDSPATGRTYSRGTRSHTASSPGNPPRADTGNYKNSTQADRVKPLEHRIVTSAEYAVWLEFGVPENNLLPRPAHGPMAAELEGLLPDFFDGFLEDKL